MVHNYPVVAGPLLSVVDGLLLSGGGLSIIIRRWMIHYYPWCMVHYSLVVDGPLLSGGEWSIIIRR
jgi:hypothetical protein